MQTVTPILGFTSLAFPLAAMAKGSAKEILYTTNWVSLLTGLVILNDWPTVRAAAVLLNIYVVVGYWIFLAPNKGYTTWVMHGGTFAFLLIAIYSGLPLGSWLHAAVIATVILSVLCLAQNSVERRLKTTVYKTKTSRRYEFFLAIAFIILGSMILHSCGSSPPRLWPQSASLL